MMAHRIAGQRERHPLEVVIDLAERLDRLANVWERQLERSTELLSLARGVQDELLVSGQFVFRQAYVGAPAAITFDFEVPYASVFVADNQSTGPITVANGATGEFLGAGTMQMPSGAFACVPLRGRHLSITSSGASSPGVQVYVAVSTAVMPPAFGQC